MEKSVVRLLVVVFIVYLLSKAIFGCLLNTIESTLAFGVFGYTLSLWIPRNGQTFWDQDGPMLKLRTWVCYFHLWMNPLEVDKLPPTSLNGSTLEEMGVLPSVDELKHEQTRPQGTLEPGYEDRIEFWAGNESGSILAIKVGLRKDRHSEAWFSWRDGAKGQIFELAQGTNYVNDETSTPNSYKSGGLTLTILEPFRRWRIVFNGILQRTDGTLFHCKLNAIWAAVDRPIQNQHECDPWTWAQIASALKLDTVSSVLSLRQQILSGIDQYGSIRGSMTLTNEADGSVNELEVQVGGLKVKDYSPYCAKQKTCLHGFTETGFGFSITVQSVNDVTVTTGHLFIAGTNVYHIEEFEEPDIRHLQANLQRRSFEPTSTFLRFKADARWFNVGITFVPKPLIQADSDATFVYAMDITFNCVRGRGMAVFFSPISEAKKELLGESVSLLVPNPIGTERQEIPLTTTLRSDICGHTSICGGKGASLGLMLKEDPGSWGENVHVPDGICVTTEGWKAQLLANPKWSDKIQEIVACQTAKLFDDTALLQLQKYCDELHQLINDGRVTEKVASEIEQGLQACFGDDWASSKRFAVRSSALGEDSEDLSAAGQNDTILGCKGRDAVEKALLQCWASLYSFQSVQYRRQNIQPIETPMAVVIQEMVEAETAGVMFSRDPATGNPSSIVITANYGLGESVVSSISEPDTIRVSYRPWEKKPSSQFKVQGINIGSKHTKIVMDQGGETCEASVGEAESKSVCLKTEMVLKLTGLAIQMEKRFGGPRDIEFAIKGDKIFLLQSRPITSLLTWTDYELLHEFDCGALSKCDVLTKANVGEVLPGALTALTTSSTGKLMDLVIQNTHSSSAVSKFSYAPQITRFTAVSHQQVFLNYLDGCLPTIVEPKKNASHKALDISVFGHEVTTQKYVDMAIERRGILTRTENFIMGLSVGKILFENILYMTFPRLGSHEFRQVSVNISEDMSPIEAFQEFQKVLLDEMPTATKNHIYVSQCSTIFQLILFMTLTENSSEWSMDTYSDATSLLVCNDVEVESAGVPKTLKMLAQAIAKNAHAKAFVDCVETQEAEKWMRSNKDPEISVAFEQILSKFHCRCLREFELNIQPWGEDCTPLVRTLKIMVEQNLASNGIENSTPKKNLEQKLDELSQKISPKARRVLKFVVPYANGSQALREKCKSVLIRHVHETRKATRQLAWVLRRQGLLPKESLIFHLTLQEIKELVTSRSPGLIHKAIRREKLFPLWNENQFPEMNEGPPVPIQVASEDVEVQREIEGSIKGTPACRGKYVGTARVVVKLADAKLIQKGDILVTVSTDIGWSPYFPLLGGVVTELGGLISHGAVVAREYGLPCIVGAQRATKAFQSGDQLEIDAHGGVVSKLAAKNNS